MLFRKWKLQIWPADDDPRKKKFITDWNAKYSEKGGLTLGVYPADEQEQQQIKELPNPKLNLISGLRCCSGCGKDRDEIGMSSRECESSSVTPATSDEARSDDIQDKSSKLNLLIGKSVNQIVDAGKDGDQLHEIELKLDNLKRLVRQLQASLNLVQPKPTPDKDGWVRMSMAVDSAQQKRSWTHLMRQATLHWRIAQEVATFNSRPLQVTKTQILGRSECCCALTVDQ